MSKQQRAAYALLGALVIIAAGVAFVLFGLDNDDDSDAPQPAVTQPVTPASGATSGATGSETSGATSASDLGPLLTSGKVTKIEAKHGDTVRFRVESDTAEEVHVHGYDIEKSVPAGETVDFEFKADLEGVFTVEFHGTDEQIGELTVEPR